jgi:hypothetical protein
MGTKKDIFYPFSNTTSLKELHTDKSNTQLTQKEWTTMCAACLKNDRKVKDNLQQI